MSLLEIENAKMYYELADNRFVKAVDDVSFSLEKGKSLGIVGESGCGKSSLAITILRLLPQNAKIMGGQIKFRGKNIFAMSDSELRTEIRWKHISMVFQGAMNVLHPVHKIGDQIVEAILAHEKVTKQEAWKRTRELLALVGIDPSRAKNYPHEFSGGMRQRTVIAAALALNPDVVIADEPTTALDVVVQAQIIKLLEELKKRLALSIILISHDVSIISEMSDKVLVMYAGQVVEYGSSEDVFLSPLHPYTIALLASVPSIKGKRQRLASIKGVPPNLANLPIGCRFAPRCPRAKPECSGQEPQLRKIEKEHYVRCFLY